MFPCCCLYRVWHSCITYGAIIPSEIPSRVPGYPFRDFALEERKIFIMYNQYLAYSHLRESMRYIWSRNGNWTWSWKSIKIYARTSIEIVGLTTHFFLLYLARVIIIECGNRAWKCNNFYCSFPSKMAVNRLGIIG